MIEFTKVAARSRFGRGRRSCPLADHREIPPQFELGIDCRPRADLPGGQSSGNEAAGRRRLRQDAGSDDGLPAGTTGMMPMLRVAGGVNATPAVGYRAITGQVQSFAEALRTDPAWRILQPRNCRSTSPPRAHFPANRVRQRHQGAEIRSRRGTRTEMNHFSAAELRKLAAALALLRGIARGRRRADLLDAAAQQRLAEERLAAARAERARGTRAAAADRGRGEEVDEELAVYRRLEGLHILGEEQRLEWGRCDDPHPHAAPTARPALHRRAQAPARSRSRASRPTWIFSPAP